jgi:hypothetical protein
MLLSGYVVLLANLLHRLRVQVEASLRSTFGQPIEVVPIKPLAVRFDRFHLRLVDEIPDKIHRRCLRLERSGVFVFHSESVGELHVQKLCRRSAAAALSIP